jgi:hypothetical protein
MPTNDFKTAAAVAGHLGHITNPASTDTVGIMRGSAGSMTFGYSEITDLIAEFQSFPSGTRMLFLQATAPTGWTQYTTHNDRLIRIVSGGTGNTAGGTWFIAGATVDAHVLTVAELASHHHTYAKVVSSTISYASGSNKASFATSTDDTSSAGNNQSHTHGFSSTGNWRPAYVDVLAATKN